MKCSWLVNNQKIWQPLQKQDFFLAVWCSGALMYIHHAKPTEKHLLLLISLERVIRPSPNHLTVIFGQWEGMFTNRKPWRQLLNFPGVGVMANSVQGQFNVQRYKETHKLHHVIYKSLQAHSVSIFITAQPITDWTSIAFIEGCARKKPVLSKKNMAVKPQKPM